MVILEFLHCVEALGCFPTQIQATVTVLIPKLKSVVRAFRGIGLLPAFYRVWSRARQGLVKAWERSNRHDFVAHQKGRSITELIYMQSAQTESAVWTGQARHTATLLWDLSNYYEHIRRGPLIDRCLALRFPSKVLRVIISQYGARRLITLQGFTQDALYPQHGIPAGCGFATYLVQGYCITCIQCWQQRHLSVPGSLFIDDITATTMADTVRKVVRALAHAAADLVDVVENELHCRLSLEKAQIVASNDRVHQALRSVLGKYAGPNVKKSGAKNLGIDYFAGSLRRSIANRQSQRDRFRKLKARNRKLLAIKSQGASMRKLYVTGLQQQGHFGQDVTGIDRAELWAQQSQFLRVVGSGGRTRSRSLSLVLHRDPSWAQGMGPVLVWAKLVCKSSSHCGSYSLQLLRDVMQPLLSKPPKDWSQVRGPLGPL